MKAVQYQKVEVALSQLLGVENPGNIRVATLICMAVFGMAFSMNAAVLFVDRGFVSIIELALSSIGVALIHAALIASGAESGANAARSRIRAAGESALDLIGAFALCYICQSVVIHDFINPVYRGLNSALMILSVIALSAVVTRKFSKLL